MINEVMTTFLVLLCCCVTSEVFHLFSSEELCLLPIWLANSLLREVSEGGKVTLAAFLFYSLDNLCCIARKPRNIAHDAESMVLLIIRRTSLYSISTNLHVFRGHCA